MKIDYFGPFLKDGCTIVGPEQNDVFLKDVFAFKASVKEQDFIETNTSVLNENSVMDFCLRLKEMIQKNRENFPVVIGGDHALSIGSVSASYEKDMALIWIDAHADSNTPETTISKRIHGMPVSILQGLGTSQLVSVCDGYLEKENILFFGLRSVDPLEKKLIEERHIKTISSDRVRKEGIENCISDAIEYLKYKRLYISLDLDSMDPTLVPGVSIPEPDGLYPKEVLQLLTALFDNCDVIGMDLVEYNHLLDENNRTVDVIREIKELIESRVL